MTYKLFYTDYCEDKHLPSEEAIETDLQSIVHSMNCVLHVPDNFLGIIDETNTTLQFMVNEDNSIHLDIPKPDEQGSYVRKITLQEAIAIVERLKGAIKPKSFKELTFESWHGSQEQKESKPWWKFW